MVIGNLLFQIELLAGELLFLYSCPKRKYFYLRYAFVVAVALACAYFFPMPKGIAYNQFYVLFRYLTLFAITTSGMAFCFKLQPFVEFALCSSGYAIQHIGFHVYSLFRKIPFSESFNAFLNDYKTWVELFIFLVCYTVVWLAVGRTAAKKQFYKNYDKRLSVISVFIIFICVGLTRIARYESSGPLSIAVSLYSITCCVSALVIELNIYRIAMLISENVVIRHLREDDKRQYESTKATIESINIKCHDLKHRLGELKSRMSEEEVRSMEEAIQFYDRRLKTKNDVLNLVIMDNILRYEQQKIKFSFMGDGADLNFVEETDLASMLGNAIGNAVEAAAQTEEEGKRNIGITVTRTGNMVTLVIRNYFVGQLKFVEGFPVTTKTEHKSSHGFGLKSIRRTAIKYGGDAKISTEGDIFNLAIYMFDNSKNKRKEEAKGSVA